MEENDVVERQVKIVSEGDGRSTWVLVDGMPLKGVQSVTWSVAGRAHKGTATIVVTNVAAEIRGTDFAVIESARASDTEEPT
jgi:hypothetical protein